MDLSDKSLLFGTVNYEGMKLLSGRIERNFLLGVTIIMSVMGGEGYGK